MMTKKENLLKVALEASVDAGKAIMKVYNLPSFESELKQDNSPLTAADKAASEIINSILVKTNIPMINEEIKNKSYQERQYWEECWIVDPLDGTKEFIKRNGEFTVNIAYYAPNSAILGIIYVPVTRELYYTDETGANAFKTIIGADHELRLEELFKIEDQIQPSPPDQNLIRVVGSRSHMNADTEDFIKELKEHYEEVEIVSKGSSLKFCLVAEGRADVYPRFAPTMEWDTAAGQAICTAVGLQVISKETNESLEYNKKNLLNPYFVVRH